MNIRVDVDWLSCWDDLRLRIGDQPTWTREQIIAEMNRIEKQRISETKDSGRSTLPQCTCKGFYKPVDCPVHGHKARGL